MALGKLGAKLCLSGAVLLLVGCAGNDFGFLSPRPPQSFEELKKAVSRLRGLPFEQEVSMETQKLEEIRSALSTAIEEESAAQLSTTGEVYKRLGLLPESVDLPKALIDLKFFQQAIRYDARKRSILVPQEPLGTAFALLRSPWRVNEEMAKQILLVHALTHALQEQHFHWQEKIKTRDTPDAKLALRALIQGDAVLVGLAYFTENGEGTKEKILAGVKSLFRLAERLDDELPQFPAVLRQTLALEYLYGSQFVSWAYSRKGWEGVNALLSDPPVSTAQILHPEKYYLKREDPLEIVPWTLIRQFGAQKIVDETLGELMVRHLLAQNLSKEDAEKIAAGWAGDTLMAFRERTDLIIGWVTAWASPSGAQDFAAAFRGGLQRRYGVALVTSPTDADKLIAPEGAHPLLLQTKDNMVLFLDGIPGPHAAEIAAGLWEELETRKAPLRVPFELAGPTQLPLGVME